MVRFNVTANNVLERYPEGRLFGREKSLKNILRANERGNYPLSEEEEKNIRQEISNVQEEIARRK